MLLLSFGPEEDIISFLLQKQTHQSLGVEDWSLLFLDFNINICISRKARLEVSLWLQTHRSCS